MAQVHSLNCRTVLPPGIVLMWVWRPHAQPEQHHGSKRREIIPRPVALPGMWFDRGEDLQQSHHG